MKERTFNHAEYTKKFVKEHYETITIRLEKGKRELVKQQAESLGMSVNAYILSLINKDLEE